MKLLNYCLIALALYMMSCGTSNGKCNEDSLHGNKDDKNELKQDSISSVKETTVVNEVKTVHDTIYLGEPTVTATKMNILYRGVENPINVTIPGIDPKYIQMRMSGGSLRSTTNGYTAVVGKGNRSYISIYAKINGKTKLLGEKEFRNKNLPDPAVFVGGYQYGRIRKQQLMAAKGLIARLENVDFDAKFAITGYTFSSTFKGQCIEIRASGNRFNSQIVTCINQLKKGQKCYFEDITAKAPDGSVRKLPAVVLRID